MNCICGCGTRLGQKGLGPNLLAGEVAIELVVWDKARALRSPAAAVEVESILATGAPHYQRLLGILHAGGELVPREQEEIDAWLADSQAARLRLGAQLPVVPRKKVKLSSEDQERIDRVHPERTFSGPAAPVHEGDRRLDALLAAANSDDYERLAVAWLGQLVSERPPSLDELRWLLGRLEDVRSGRRDEAEPALRRFLSERS